MRAWKTVALGDLVDRAQTWNPSRSGPQEVFDYIDLSAVDQDAKVIIGPRELPCSEAPSRARQLVVKGDVFVSTVRPNLNGVARVPETLDGATASTGFCILRADPTVLDSTYLFHWVKSPTFVNDMVRKSTGANYPAVSDRIIFESRFPLPPLPEQRRIAAILDKANALRAKRRAALTQLDTLTQSIFLEMFGDLLKEPDRWPRETLGSQLDFLTSGSRGWAQYYRETGSIFLRIQNVRRDELVLEDVARVDAPHTVEARRIRVQAGDVLLSMTADLGRTAVMPEGLGAAYINQHLAILRAPKLEPRFLSAYLSCPAGQRQILGRNRQAVKAGLNFDDVRSIRLSLPPLPLQREFAVRVAAVERLKSAQRESLATLDALFASLQHRAFRGEL